MTRLEALEALAKVAKEIVIDQRNLYPEDAPRWAECLVATPETERLADALIELDKST